MIQSCGLFRKSLLMSGLTAALTIACGGAQAHRYSLIYAFKGGNDGAAPGSGVIMDSAGDLLGATNEGGDPNACNGYGCGTVFKITPDGVETVLHVFKGGSDGVQPNGIVQDQNGNIYGTTVSGGGQGCGGYGCGTVFKLAPDGSETVLYAFTGATDGSNPQKALWLDKAGSVYGTTSAGGAYSAGTVFVVAPGGQETVLHAFCSQNNCADGAYPYSQLISDRSGNLYGTTLYGGSAGGGTVFRIRKKTGGESVLYNFCSQQNCEDGAGPEAGVTIDRDGNLYGTTSAGGAYLDYGTVFKLAPDGTESVLHSFDPGSNDGTMPFSGVILDRRGNIYGTTLQANVEKCGLWGQSVVYKLTPAGGETLHCVPSQLPAGLIERNGYLYGTGWGTGKYPYGIVFSMKK